MQTLWENKYIRFGMFTVGALAVAFLTLVLLASLSGTGSVGISDSAKNMIAPSSVPSAGMMERVVDEDMASMLDSYYEPSIVPTSDSGYASELELYETTHYSITGRIAEFDSFCNTLVDLKARADVHVKLLDESTNRCGATLYVEKNAAAGVLSELTSFDAVEFTRTTESVTRHRQQLESRTAVLEAQLASVDQSLTLAETEFDELAMFARNANDAEALSEAIRFKLQNIDTLTQRKISLTSQLDNLYQQAADLEERLGVVEFSVSVMRANPIYIGKYDRKWEQAWEELKDTFTDTVIGVTIFFGVFLLWVVRIGLYLLLLIVALRYLWKFGQFMWRR